MILKDHVTLKTGVMMLKHHNKLDGQIDRSFINPQYENCAAVRKHCQVLADNALQPIVHTTVYTTYTYNIQYNRISYEHTVHDASLIHKVIKYIYHIYNCTHTKVNC